MFHELSHGNDSFFGPRGVRLGRICLQLAQTPEQHAQLAALRAERFSENGPLHHEGDAFDPLFLHLMASCTNTGRVLASARFRVLSGPAQICSSYTGQFYDLLPVTQQFTRALEIGRLCQSATTEDGPDALRGLLVALTMIAQKAQIQILLGCVSFKGDDPARHWAALGWLRRHHLGPVNLRPGRRMPAAVDLPDLAPDAGQADMHTGRESVPALLRMYLRMGGWVSDHAVPDPMLGTLHVFLGLAMQDIPSARLRVLQGAVQAVHPD